MVVDSYFTFCLILFLELINCIAQLNISTHSTPDTNCSLNQLWDCLHDIFHLLTDSKLKLNADKTEFLIIGVQKQRGKLDCFFPDTCVEPEFYTGRLNMRRKSHL